MKLVSVRPVKPSTLGRVTTFGYDIELEGDFFSFGELCSKLENSRRVIALTSFALTQTSRSTSSANDGKTEKGISRPLPDRRSVTIRIHLDTFSVKKGP